MENLFQWKQNQLKDQKPHKLTKLKKTQKEHQVLKKQELSWVQDQCEIQLNSYSKQNYYNYLSLRGKARNSKIRTYMYFKVESLNYSNLSIDII